MKRVLILANNCLSDTNANGRTLANMLAGYPKDCLAQFTLRADDPNFECCENYFFVSDSEALQAFIKGKRVGRRLKKQPYCTKAEAGTERKHGRTSVTMLLRDLVWNSGRWKKGGFCSFVRAFAPEVILLQAGDCAFLLRLARKLSKEYQIPLVIYNSEGYYFKDYDYFRANGFAHLCYPLFRRMLCREFRKTMQAASYVVYLCDELKAAYDAEFTCPSEVIYTATQLQPADKLRAGPLSAVYLGNLGLCRHESLIELAQTLQKVEPGALLHIYGRAPNESVAKTLRACGAIQLHGFVPYDEVRRVMAEAVLLVHAENFSEFFRKELIYAFSTKIPDCLASGSCFLLYAPSELAVTKYLMNTESAYVATDRAQLETYLRLLHERPEERERYLERAKAVVAKNHNAAKNSARFCVILNGQL